MSLRIVFMGTPAFSVPTLRTLAEAGHAIAAVYTQPPRPAGRRGLAPTPSPVAVEAGRLGLPVRAPVSLRGEDEQRDFAALGADLAVVVAYGLILPRPILTSPRHGALNGHASLLPRWRGAAPIQRAIEAGDAETGVMVMGMEEGLDTGPVAVTSTTPIGPTDTAADLHDRLSLLCADSMREALERLEAGSLDLEDQAALGARTGREILYARKIDKSETRIDFTGNAHAVAARINAFAPFPGAWTLMDLGQGSERVKLLRARAVEGAGEAGTVLPGRLRIACAQGAVELLELQRAGARAMDAEAFARGTAIAPGLRLG